jgi:hypothetical protein
MPRWSLGFLETETMSSDLFELVVRSVGTNLAEVVTRSIVG